MAFNFNALVDEFKRTNWQQPGTWHVAPKLLVLLAAAGAKRGGGHQHRDAGGTAHHLPFLPACALRCAATSSSSR